MRKPRALSVTAILLAATNAHAVGLIETFDYGSANVGLPIFGLNNPMTADPWAEANSSVAGSPFLSASPVIPGSPGGSLVFTSATTESSPRIPISELSINTPGTTLYYSFDFVLVDATGLGSAPAPLAAFNNSTGTQTANPAQLGTMFIIRRDAFNPDNFNVGVARNHNSTNPPGSFAYHTGSYPIGTPVRIVGSYTVNGTGTGGTTAMDDRHSIWVNPGDAGAPAAPAFNVSTLGGDIATGLLSFVALGGANRPAGYAFGNLRVADYWAGVNPAPGTNWPGGSGPWSSSALVAADRTSDANGGGLPDEPNETVNFLSGGGIVDVGPAGKTVGHVNFEGPITFNLTGAGTVTVTTGDPAGTASINVHPFVDPATGVRAPAIHEISAPLSAPNGRLLLNVGADQTLNLTGGISTDDGLTKDGAGTARLHGDLSDLLGPVTFRGGVTVLSGDIYGVSASQFVLAGGTLRLEKTITGADTLAGITVLTPPIAAQRAGIIDTAGNHHTITASINGGRLTLVGAGSVTSTASANTFAGLDLDTMFVASTEPQLGTPAAINGIGPSAGLTVTDPFTSPVARTVNTGPDGFTFVVRDAGETFTFAGAVTGTGGVIKDGEGDLVFTSTSNTFNGPVTVQRGTLVGNAFSLGSLSSSANTFNLSGGGIRFDAMTANTSRYLGVDADGGAIYTNPGATTTFLRSSAGTLATIGGELDIAGNGTVVFNQATGTIVVTPGGFIHVNAGAAFRYGGTSIAPVPFPVVNDGTFTAQSASRATGPITGTGNTVVAANASLTTPQFVQGQLQLGANARIILIDNGSSATTTDIDPTAEIDFFGYMVDAYFGDITVDEAIDMILDETFTSSFPDPDDVFGLGTMPLPGGGSRTMFTVFGDANLDGRIDGDDWALVDLGFAQQPVDPGWVKGDFNYDGEVNEVDYEKLYYGSYWQEGGHSPALLAQLESRFGPGYVQSLIASTPEPAALSSILYPLSACLLARRRQRGTPPRRV